MTERGCPARFDEQRRVWVVDDPRQVRHVLLDPATFPPDNALEAYTQITPASLRVLAAAGFALPPTLASNSGATHRPIRQSVARFMSPRRVDAAETLVERLTLESLPALRAGLADGESADLVEHVAGPVPAATLFNLLGLGAVPTDLKRWSQHSLELFWGTPDDERQLELADSAADYYRWLRMMTRAAGAAPGADLLSSLIRLGLSEREVCSTAYFLLIAGQETTSMLISSIIQRLLSRPGDWLAAGTDPSAVKEAVDATLREDSSVPTWRRTTHTDVGLGGVTLPAKAEVLLTLSGAGGDADLAFGVGVHRCLGAALARMEARIVVQTLARTLPTLRLAETAPPRIELLSFAAPQRLLVVDEAAGPQPNRRLDRAAGRPGPVAGD